LLQEWGSLVGKMHNATKDYEPSRSISKRVEWNEEEYHQNIQNLAKPEHGKIFIEYKRINSLLENLSKDRDSYGLIHADLHTGNFHVDRDEKIMFFDFDDCLYSWFIYDIVVFIWAMDRFEISKEHLINQIRLGYDKFNTLDDKWFDLIDEFYDYRVILIHYYCMKSLEDPKLDQTSREWMEKRVKESRDYFEKKQD
jgi:Ser/Thr protein kinase RdoA (MazF antagonist)